MLKRTVWGIQDVLAEMEYNNKCLQIRMVLILP